MSGKFYTNVSLVGNNILLVGYEDGRRIKQKIKYEPYLFVNSQKDSKYSTLDGHPVDIVRFDTVKEARGFLQEYKDVEGFPIYGLDKFAYTFIYDEYKQHGDIEYDSSLISVSNIDIEVSIVDGKGFPDIQAAENEITLITISNKGHRYIFGCQEYTGEEIPNSTYIKCRDEIDLIHKFLDKWEQLETDIITGWNVEGFDIPYLVNRIAKLLGKEAASRLSPWRYLREMTIESRGKEVQVFIPSGISTLDYLQLYKKFSYNQQESYALGNIGEEELGIKKIEYEGTLADLEVKDWNKYVLYNVRDTEIVDLLDDKLKLIELVLAMAYDAGVNYQDTFTTVNIWDVIIHNYLMDHGIVVHQFKMKRALRQIVGGYVKEPQVGLHEWVVSFDLTSLYPMIIQQYNISPETYRGKAPFAFDVDGLLNGLLDDPDKRSFLEENNYSLAANGCLFSREKQGFMATLMAKMFVDRKRFKDAMIAAQKESEKTTDKAEKSRLLKDVAKFNSLQQSKKIQLNGFYGSLANEYNRWFEADFAEAITMSGQLSTKWIEMHLNQYLNKLFKTMNVDYVIACDTDSAYLRLDKIAEMSKQKGSKEEIVAWMDKVCEEALTPFIQKKYEQLYRYMNAFEQKMNMKRECIADRGIFIARKRYVLNVYNQEGVAYAEPKLKMTGIEAIRTSTPQSCRDSIKTALKLVMTSSESNFQKYIARFKDEFCELPVSRIAFPRGVSDMDKWSSNSTIWIKSTPIHVKGSLVYNWLIKKHNLSNKYQPIVNGQKIKFVYLKTPNPYRINVISFPDEIPSEFGLDRYIDHEMQFEKAFLGPINNIVEKIGWECEERSTLEGFFG